MIKGINHITFSVRSLTESFAFYRDILGFKPLMKNDKSAYFLAGDLWFCIEEDPEVRLSELPEYTHTAFAVDQSDFDSIRQKIICAKTKIFKENTSEGDSLYFLDPNGHKLEIHVGDWKTRLDRYRNHSGTELYDL